MRLNETIDPCYTVKCEKVTESSPPPFRVFPPFFINSRLPGRLSILIDFYIDKLSRGGEMANEKNVKKLTARQERFCREYIIDYNATKAAVRAGYSEKTAKSIGSENLTKPDILARVRELQKEQTKRLCISADWVMQNLVEVYRRCMKQEEVMVWDAEQRKKVPSGEYVFDSKGALNALEMLGKHLAMFDGKAVTQDNKKDASKLFEALTGGTEV